VNLSFLGDREGEVYFFVIEGFEEILDLWSFYCSKHLEGFFVILAGWVS
jgi:hypothetical protein